MREFEESPLIKREAGARVAFASYFFAAREIFLGKTLCKCEKVWYNKKKENYGYDYGVMDGFGGRRCDDHRSGYRLFL